MNENFVRLGDTLLFMRNGLSVKQSKSEGGLPITRIETISKAIINAEKVGYAGLELSQCKGWLLEEGDILFSHINSIEHLGKCAMYEGNPETLVHGMNLLCLRTNPEITYSRFLLRFLRSPNFRVPLERIINPSVNQASVSISNLKEIRIPLPPLAEQKRIATILDEADALRRKRREALAKLDALLQSVFLDMFGDPVTNTKGWELATIGDMVQDVSYGTSSKAGSEGAFPILRMGNITYDGSWNFADLKYIDLTKAEQPKYLVRRGDILFNRTNSKELVGKTAVYREEKLMAYAGYLIRVRPKPEHSSEYISAYLNSVHGKTVLRNMCKSIIGMANINASELKTIPIMVPPSPLQSEYEKKVAAIRAMREPHQKSLSHLETLFTSLQQQAFSSPPTETNTTETPIPPCLTFNF